MLWAARHLEPYCWKRDLAHPIGPSQKVLEVGHSLAFPATLIHSHAKHLVPITTQGFKTQ